MTDEQPLYRFKWSNVGLEDYAKERRMAATMLRRDAEILIKRAEQVEIEAGEWERALVQHKSEKAK